MLSCRVVSRWKGRIGHCAAATLYKWKWCWRGGGGSETEEKAGEGLEGTGGKACEGAWVLLSQVMPS